MLLDIVFHYDVNETTGEVSYIGQDKISVDSKKTSKKKSSEEKTEVKPKSDKPIITLESNKLVVSEKAKELLKLCDECRVEIKYKDDKNKKGMPVIGINTAFGTNSGNLLRKNGSISFSGSANAKLATFGNEFVLEPTDIDGVFWLVGNKNLEAPEIPDEIIDIESELDNINNISDEDMRKFNFKL